MPRLRQVPRDEAARSVRGMYSMLFGDRDPVAEPGYVAPTVLPPLREVRLEDVQGLPPPIGQQAAPLPPYDRIFFTADANAPMRVSVQLRFAQGERWFSSVYVESDARRVILPVADLVHAGDRSAARPDFRQATSILFVVDLTNAVPGASGRVRVRDLAFGAPVGGR